MATPATFPSVSEWVSEVRGLGGARGWDGMGWDGRTSLPPAVFTPVVPQFKDDKSAARAVTKSESAKR